VFAALKKKLFGSDSSSKGLAKSRLHFVLVNDRTGLTGDEMAQFKRELVSVIERFFEINPDGFDVSYKRDEGMTTLLINSPVLVRRKEIVGSPNTNSSGKKKRSAEEGVQPAAEA
jgi:cell division topological specificity factor